MKTLQVDVASLEVCDRTRVRKYKPSDHSEVVDEYTEAYRCGLITEPLDVFHEKGTERYLVADGEHRLLALQRAKIKQVEARIHEGDETAALDFAIGCNHEHGVRLTKKDRYHMFERIMETPLKEKYRTDTDLSEKLGISKSTVANYKVQWRNSDSGGDRGVQRKKEKSREDASKKTKSGLQVRKELNGTKQSIEPTPKTNEEPKRAAAEATWSHADEHAYSLLKSAWNKATTAARRKFLEEVG